MRTYDKKTEELYEMALKAFQKTELKKKGTKLQSATHQSPSDITDKIYFERLVKYHQSMARRHGDIAAKTNDEQHERAENLHFASLSHLSRYNFDRSPSYYEKATIASHAARAGSRFARHLPGFENFSPPRRRG